MIDLGGGRFVSGLVLCSVWLELGPGCWLWTWEGVVVVLVGIALA